MDPTGNDWTHKEIDLVVADYFLMRDQELLGNPYVKAHHNAELQKLIGRSRGSIEYKYQNISAVVMTLGEPRIQGYKPAWNFQNALVFGVERFLDTRVDISPKVIVTNDNFSEEGVLYTTETPARIPPAEKIPAELTRLVRKFDPAARDARNRDLGYMGEERVLRSEHTRLRAVGRDDLARRIRWVAQEDGDGAGYDILSYSENGSERFLEVKTTTGYVRTPFYISANERLFSEERPDKFRLFRVYDFATDPKVFTIQPPLENSLVIEPSIFKASFS